jgi:hypothetical protein
MRSTKISHDSILYRKTSSYSGKNGMAVCVSIHLKLNRGIRRTARFMVGLPSYMIAQQQYE